MESAGVTLVKGDLRGIVRARRLSRQTMTNIRQNLFFAFVYNAARRADRRGRAVSGLRRAAESDDRGRGHELQLGLGDCQCAAAAARVCKMLEPLSSLAKLTTKCRRRKARGCCCSGVRTGALEVLLGPSGRPLLDWPRRGRLDDPEGRHSSRRGSARRRRFASSPKRRASCRPVHFSRWAQITQRSGKLVHAWAFEGDCDPRASSSILTTTEWPPRIGPDHRDSRNRSRRFFSGRPTPAAPSTSRRSSSSTGWKSS